jgi:peptidoglycan/LPS O-acetylase OafA/YrhL
MNEAELDRELLRRGIGFVTDDPIRYAHLSIDRTKEYFKFWPTADSSALSNAVRVLSFGLLAPFLVGGVILAIVRQRSEDPPRGAVLLLLVAGLYTLLHLLTWSLVRYRLPVDAITMPLAAYCVVTLSRRVLSLPRASELVPDATN